MKLNFFKRSMIFATFFGACLCIALIVASLGTTHWIDARARRTSNPMKSEGRINFGLFEGRKELNSGFGWRNHDFSVGTSSGPHPAHPAHPARRWAWLGATALLGAALVAAAGACAFAALASASRAHCEPRVLLVGNSLAVLFTLGAIAVWLTEYFLRLQYNVMSDEDLANTWSSDGMAELGLSFWLVAAASAAAGANVACVLVAAAAGERLHQRGGAPPLEDKLNPAIMLY